MKKLLTAFLILLFLISSFTVNALNISAKSAIVISADTGEILYSKSADERLPMASTTKIMTALLTCENGELDKTVSITKDMIMVEGTSMGLSAGDTVTRRDLLYGMMLISGNDAANALAFSVGGSYDEFIALMNKRAEQMGLRNTHFATPSGLDGEGHYTSAYDLALISKQAFMYDDFKTVVSTESILLNYGNPPCKRQLVNHNKLLKMYSDVTGVKTGYTKKSGRCLVSSAEKDGKRVIAVTLNDGNDWEDHRELLNLGLSALKEQSVSGYTVSVPVVGANKRLTAKTALRTVSVSKDTAVTERIVLPPFLYSPVCKGDVIGYTECFVGDRRIYKEDILSNADIKRKTDPLKSYITCFILILRSINERQ